MITLKYEFVYDNNRCKKCTYRPEACITADRKQNVGRIHFLCLLLSPLLFFSLLDKLMTTVKVVCDTRMFV